MDATDKLRLHRDIQRLAADDPALSRRLTDRNAAGGTFMDAFMDALESITTPFADRVLAEMKKLMPAFIVDRPRDRYFEDGASVVIAPITAFTEDDTGSTPWEGEIQIKVNARNGPWVYVRVAVGRSEDETEFDPSRMTPAQVAARAVKVIDKHGLLSGGPLD